MGGSVQKSKQTCRRSPSGQLFHELIERAKTLRDQIDTSKTVDELELQKKLEKEILTANKQYSEMRMAALEGQITEYANTF